MYLFNTYLFDCSGYIFIWLWWVLVVAHGIFNCSIQTLSCGMWNLVPWLGNNFGPLTLRAQNLSYWTTREVPNIAFWLSSPLLHKYLVCVFSLVRSYHSLYYLQKNNNNNNRCHFLPQLLSISLFFFFFSFLLKDNCFTEFCCFQSNLNMNQL